MNAAPTSFPPPRVAARLAPAFGGIWRLTFRRFLLPSRWLTLGIGLGVLFLISFAAGHRRSEWAFYAEWATRFYVTFLVPALAFIAAGGAIRDDMKSGTVDYVLTRPIPRWAFVAFRYVAHMACTQIDFLLALGVVVGVGYLRDVPDLAGALPKLLLGQVLMVAAYSALGFLGGVLSSRYVVLGLAYALAIEVGVGQIPTQLSRLSMTHQTRDLLLSLLGKVGDFTSAPSLLGTTGLLVVFSAVLLGAACALFAVRELSGPGDA